jgi:prepilin-type N-terminal cleavage/methylation domain-containing protein
MKTIKSDANSRRQSVQWVGRRCCAAGYDGRAAVRPYLLAFTLIELLTVIAIIGVIAGFVLVVAGPVKKKQYIFNTQAQMAQLETAIDRYKAAYGFYPPDNQLTPVANPMINQLYYELTGTTNLDVNSPKYQSLNDPTLPILTGGTAGSDVEKAFGVGGFMNCSKPAGGEDVAAARNFLPDLRPNQIGTNTVGGVGGVVVTLLVSSIGGPDATYLPLAGSDVNPWRYNSSNPTNNPGSYELWIQLSIGRQTNLICNWTKQVQINSPLP